MMKFLLSIFIFFGLVLGGLYFLAFTPSGNNLLLPYINGYLAENVKAARVEVTRLNLKPSSLQATAKINELINVEASGPFDIMSKAFDLDYTIDAPKIKTEQIEINEKIHITGKAKGDPEHITIQGDGKAFKSDIAYALKVIESQPQNIKIDMEGAAISEILAVAGLKPYATGRLSLHADMPELDPNDPQGKAVLKVTDGSVSSPLLKRDFSLDTPADTNFSADVVSQVEAGKVALKGDILSNLATIHLRNGAYQLDNQHFNGEYALNIPDMSRLHTLTKAPLKGELKADGTIKKSQEALIITGLTHSFGGDTTYYYAGDSLKAKLSKVKTATLLSKLGQPAYLNATADANINLTSLTKLSGAFDAVIDGAANTKVIKKAFDLNLGKEFTLHASSKGTIKEQKVYTSLNANTTMGKLLLNNLIYDIQNATLSSKYTLSLPDMGKLQPLTGKRYSGDMLINGNIKKSKDLIIDGQGKEFDGSIDFKVVNNRLNADVKGATVSKVMQMLNYPQVFEALSAAKIDYNLATKQGSVDATMDNARILPNQLTALVNQFVKFDLVKERYNNSKLLAKIAGNAINFNVNAQSTNSHFKIDKGFLNKLTGAINATIDLKIKDKDLKATIKGTVERPKVHLDASAFLKSKVKKKVDDFIEKKLKLPSGQGGEQIKGLLKGLF
jgi:hypothetical protein